MADLQEFVLPDGTTRRLGNNAPPAGLLRAWPTYGDTPNAPMIRRQDWKPVSLMQYCSPIKDQNGQGACNAFDTIYIMESCRRMQGLPDVKLSPGFLYGAINGGRDQGSMLEDAMQWVMEHGTCTAETIGELDWKHRPAAAVEEAKRFRVLEAYNCPTFDHMASAVQSGFWVSSGLMWYDNFNTDGDGWLPTRGRGSAGGHAVARGSLEYRNGVWGLGGPNSWTVQYGANGCMVIPEPLYGEQIGGFWAVRGMVDEGGGMPAPKF